MRIRSGPITWIVASLLLVNICGWIGATWWLGRTPSVAVRCVGILPDPEATVRDRVTILFDRGLAIPTPEGETLPEPPFTIEPRFPDVVESWAWDAEDRLSVRFDPPLPRGRRLTLRPRADFAALTGAILEDPAPVAMTTGALTVDRVFLIAADEEEALVRLLFDQPVSPRSLREALTVSSGGDPVTFRLREDAATMDHVVECARPDDATITFAIAGGLPAVGGELPLERTVVRRVELPTDFAFLSSSVDPPSLRREGTVKLRFSGKLSGSVVTDSLRIEPAVDGLRLRHARDRELWVGGAFEPGMAYAVTIPATILSADGRTLGDARTVTVTFPDQAADLDFPLSSGVLSPDGNRALRLDAVNVDRVALDISRVHDDNIVSHLLGNGPHETSRELGRKRVVLDGPPNRPQEIALDLAALLGDDARGIYRVRAIAEGHRYVGDRAVVSISDLGLRGRFGPREALVWVTSIREGAPLDGVEVRLITRNDQVLATGTTGPDGRATIPLPTIRPDGDPFVVLAIRGEDRSFLRVDGPADAIDGVDLSGRPWPDLHDVFLTSERGAYRPGETIHLSGIVREADGVVPAAFPVELSLTRPDGREVERAVVPLAAELQGCFTHSFSTVPDAMPGTYAVDVTLPGGGETLGRTEFAVEHFVPARLEVVASLAEERSGPKSTPDLSATARYLHGSPAAQLPWTVVARFDPRTPSSERFPEFRFSTEGERKTVTKEMKALALDVHGRGSLTVPEPGDPRTRGLWDVTLSASVTEPGSRTVSTTVRGLHDSVGRHLGIAAPPEGTRPGFQTEARAVIVDGEDQPVAGQGDWRLVRLETDWQLRNVEGRISWVREVDEIEVVEGTVEIPADGPAEIAFVLPENGRYRLRVREEETGRTTVRSFSCWDSNLAPPERERGEQLAIALPDGPVLPGSTLTARIDAPFGGALLWSVETDRIVRSGVVDAIAEDGTFDVPVPEGLRGTAFLAATVVRAVDPSERDWRPHRANGMARIPLPREPHRLPLTISSDEGHGPPSLSAAPLPAMRPGERRAFAVTTERPAPDAAPAVVQLWGVDTGILLATGFETPDPFEHFLAPRRAAVRATDLYGTLLPDHVPASDLGFIGGDRAAKRRARLGSVPLERIAPAVVVTDFRPVDDDGIARFDIELPEHNGELTWFALAVSGDRYAAARVAGPVRAPVIVENPWPRAVAPGDRFTVPFRLVNTTERDLAVLPTLEVEGPLEVTLDVPREGLRLEAGATLAFTVTARATGEGPVETRAGIASLGDDGLEIPPTRGRFLVRPVTVFGRAVAIERVEAGGAIELPAPDAFIGERSETTVLVRTSPRVELVPAIGALVDYPYGCAEQTSSRLLALAVAVDPAVGYVDSDARLGVLTAMTRVGIDRIDRMTNADGGVGYWSGDTSSPWTSAHAYEALRSLAATGIEVPESLLDRLGGFLRKSLERSGGDRPLDPNTRVRLLALLADGPNPPRGRIVRWTEQLHALDPGGRAWLAEAWLALGEPERARTVLEGDGLTATVMPTASGRITSTVAQRARLLETLVAIDPEDPRVGALIESLSEHRRDGRWGNTHENARAIRALARAAEARGDGATEIAFSGVVRVGDEEAAFTHESGARLATSGAVPVRIESEGTGPFSVVTITEGPHAEPPEPFERGLRIARRWVRVDGTEIEPGTTLSVGDLVIAEVSIRATGSDETRRNIVIVDALPGGLEPENPRLITSAVAATGSEDPRADLVEFLDDRVLLFSSASGKERTYRYGLRASTAGTFSVPPLEASSMYDPDLGALTAGETVTIEERP